MIATMQLATLDQAAGVLIGMDLSHLQQMQQHFLNEVFLHLGFSGDSRSNIPRRLCSNSIFSYFPIHILPPPDEPTRQNSQIGWQSVQACKISPPVASLFSRRRASDEGMPGGNSRIFFNTLNAASLRMQQRFRSAEGEDTK